ncbi:MAG: ABC transporter permease [Bacteroidales bacterium]|nr:ABC transporter permease [Bacteroidales bacterium]
MPLQRVILRELRRIVHNPRYPIILTLGIVVAFFIFAFMTRQGQPQRLPIAVVDMDGTYLSRRICHEINSTPGVEVFAVYNNHSEARKAMQRGKIYAFYEIPKGTYNDLLQFRAPHFVLYVNSAYMLAGTLSYKQLATMGMLAAAAVQREVYRKKGFGDDQIMGLIQPVEYDTRNIGNPWINYGSYLMTTLIPAIIAFIMVMHTTYSIARERQERSVKSWLRKARGNILAALLGKVIPYMLWYSFLCLLANLIMFGFMGFPMEGSWMLMVLNSILLIVAAGCVGCFIGSCVVDPPLAMSVAAIYSAMSFSFSGFSFPIDSMPHVFQWIAWLYPIRQYFLNYSDIAIFDNGFSNYWPHFCILLLFCILLIPAAWMLQWQQQRDGKNVAKT